MDEENTDKQATSETVSNNGTSTHGADGKIEALGELAEKFKNDYLYLRAEFDNYRRHVVKERAELQKFASEKVLHDLLGILDNFELALSFKMTAENQANYVKGVEMIAGEIRNLLSRNGISEVPTDGQAFDPNLHEALTSESTEKINPGFVLRTFKKGYRLHDKLIRPAQVIVAKRPD